MRLGEDLRTRLSLNFPDFFLAIPRVKTSGLPNQEPRPRRREEEQTWLRNDDPTEDNIPAAAAATAVVTMVIVAVQGRGSGVTVM